MPEILRAFTLKKFRKAISKVGQHNFVRIRWFLSIEITKGMMMIKGL